MTPAEGWSYMGKKGHTSRIDHGLLSPGLVAKETWYVAEADGVVLAGSHPPAYSDHAVLVIDFPTERATGSQSAR